ncbi:Rossmann-fold NAD(P)-binding domain-containing protein [Flexibacterium corallicola]|uniref:hypothetical protein n=1 Tax=Flexibacterium corallicola TaxID=3037259 RepID=UPI00286F6245|nr:hypothetical protein [Pseudovibrio sp. M1P-2-3]
MKQAAIFGASGAIGSALLSHLNAQNRFDRIHAVSRSLLPPTLHFQTMQFHHLKADNLKACCDRITESGPLSLVIVTSGVLQTPTASPEKSAGDINISSMQEIFSANTFFPAAILSHLLRVMPRKQPYSFAALSARVGSISDNHLGGWYSYRASKAALNMVIKTASIEATRLNPRSVIVGLHPGTVASPLSHPFQRFVPKGKLFTPEFSAACLWRVLDGLTPKETGKCFAWDGKEVPA